MACVLPRVLPRLPWRRAPTAAPPRSDSRGKTALEIAQRLLAGGPGEGEEAGFTDLELYSFRAVPSSKRLDIRLDKMTGGEDGGPGPGAAFIAVCGGSEAPHAVGISSALAPTTLEFALGCEQIPLPTHPPPADEYGSPSLDEVIGYSRAFNAALVAALGEEAAGEIEVEVSSPVSAALAGCLPWPGMLDTLASLSNSTP